MCYNASISNEPFFNMKRRFLFARLSNVWSFLLVTMVRSAENRITFVIRQLSTASLDSNFWDEMIVESG